MFHMEHASGADLRGEEKVLRKASGRPKSIDGIELLTLDDVVARAQEYLSLSKPPFGRRTLQNKLSRGEFTRYGTYKIPMLDWSEVKRSLNWRRKVSA